MKYAPAVIFLMLLTLFLNHFVRGLNVWGLGFLCVFAFVWMVNND